MNCKNCRVKGCWSRGIPRGSQYYKKSIETVTPQPFYNLPKFRQSLYNNCNLDDDRPPLLTTLVGRYVDGENNGDERQDLS